jgi:hypothetical protein
MSYWLSAKNGNGQKHTVLIDIPPFILIIITGILAAITIPNIFAHPKSSFIIIWAIIIIGLILFIIAKVSIFPKGFLMSFGTKAMTPFYRKLYYIGYTLITLGCLALLLYIKII